MTRTALHPEAPHRCVVEWTSPRYLHAGMSAFYWRMLPVLHAWFAADFPPGTDSPRLERRRRWQSPAAASVCVPGPPDSSHFPLLPPETRRAFRMVRFAEPSMHRTTRLNYVQDHILLDERRWLAQ